ncbi:hypothetical protein IMG5_076680 [Ichthyophthirius multifiliis]|uniref:Transmembrane protein n=1 Tax=Ichthyophthirius multifiliis TaxID=5932 RepID=G0QQ78_ICHMU|nr:hypothetical protein IMG5_076680 [Ichthyophthirius multifiliis]EGR32638.1 hypothetical protein IMG5_076680 [Ichthyophthirius multifiliis]|eukprot:XP_004036624.1 hypothetical protein IMG5_076680 [Ichthyophthirius multifiliis]
MMPVIGILLLYFSIQHQVYFSVIYFQFNLRKIYFQKALILKNINQVITLKQQVHLRIQNLQIFEKIYPKEIKKYQKLIYQDLQQKLILLFGQFNYQYGILLFFLQHNIYFFLYFIFNSLN